MSASAKSSWWSMDQPLQRRSTWVSVRLRRVTASTKRLRSDSKEGWRRPSCCCHCFCLLWACFRVWRCCLICCRCISTFRRRPRAPRGEGGATLYLLPPLLLLLLLLFFLCLLPSPLQSSKDPPGLLIVWFSSPSSSSASPSRLCERSIVCNSTVSSTAAARQARCRRPDK